MNTLLFALLASLPSTQDVEPPGAALTGPSSARLALPVIVRFDDSVQSEVTDLVSATGATDKALNSKDPIAALSQFAPAIARRHFEQAKWGDKTGERSIVIKSVSVSWRDGPSYEIKVVVDRYEGERRLGQSSGSGFATANRTGQRQGAAWAGPFGGAVMNKANKPNAQTDGTVLQQATIAAFDSALMQLSAVWNGEQMMAKARADADAMMKKALEQQKPAKKSKK
jgi:hypothetical protein